MNKKQLIILLLLFTFFNAFSSDFVKLGLKVKEVKKDEVICDFYFDVVIKKNDTIDIYLLALPFGENKQLKKSTISNETDLVVASGFTPSNHGVAIINSIYNEVKFKTEFVDVTIPIKKVHSENDGLLINLPLSFANNLLAKNASNIHHLVINEIIIESEMLINSYPKFQLIDKGKYKISLSGADNNMYFIIPTPQESFLKTFFGFLVIAVILGFIAAFKLLKGKRESYWGLGLSLIVLGYLIYLFVNKVIPTDFNKDLDMISIVGGGIGLVLGVIFNSSKNLIEYYAIERQQG
jgi:hypothetical protein